MCIEKHKTKGYVMGIKQLGIFIKLTDWISNNWDGEASNLFIKYIAALSVVALCAMPAICHYMGLIG